MKRANFTISPSYFQTADEAESREFQMWLMLPAIAVAVLAFMAVWGH